MTDAQTLDQTAIRSLIPHAEKMCLLEAVQRWDTESILCSAVSHRDTDNPLRHQEQLPVHAGIEYAAQAMAVHGALCSSDEHTRREGYIAVLSKVDWHCDRLDTLSDALAVTATRLVATATGFHYSFEVSHQGSTLIEGQTIVSLR